MRTEEQRKKQREYMRKWRAENPDKNLEAVRKYSKGVAWIAVPPEWEGSKIMLTTSHYCRERVYEGAVLWEEMKKKGKV